MYLHRLLLFLDQFLLFEDVAHPSPLLLHVLFIFEDEILRKEGIEGCS